MVQELQTVLRDASGAQAMQGRDLFEIILFPDALDLFQRIPFVFQLCPLL